MTSPDQPAPGLYTPESGQDSGPVEGAGESGDVDPREPMEDASDLTLSSGDTGDTEDTKAPDPLEAPD